MTAFSQHFAPGGALHSAKTKRVRSVSVQVDSVFGLHLPEGVYEIKRMEARSRWRGLILLCLALAIAGIVGFGYFCNEQVRTLAGLDGDRYINKLRRRGCLQLQDEIPQKCVVETGSS